MTDYKKQMSRGTTKHVKSFSNEIKIDEQMNEFKSQRQRYTKARNIDSELKRFSSTNKQFYCGHDARNYKSRPKTSKQFQGNSSYVKDKQPTKQDDKLKKYKNHGNVTRIVKCNFNTKLEQTLVNLKGHASAPDLLKSTKSKVSSSIPISYSSSATQEGQYSSGTYKPESGIHTSMSKQKSNRNNSGRQESSKEVDLAVKITRSEIRRSKNMQGKSEKCNDKNLSTRKSGNSSCEELSKQHVIRTMESQLDDGTTTSLRRYALYRSMINSCRLSDFLSNQQNQVSNNSGEPTDNAGSVPPWDHDDDMYDKLTAYKSPKPKPIARVVSEPDITPNKWDLMGTYFPKRIYIRETVNGCVIDEVVDVKDEKDWDILTYMSPLRHIDVTHRRKGKPRDLSFADLKDFETYTYAYPWKLT